MNIHEYYLFFFRLQTNEESLSNKENILKSSEESDEGKASITRRKYNLSK